MTGNAYKKDQTVSETRVFFIFYPGYKYVEYGSQECIHDLNK
jgi:hypothetical protein